MNKKLLCALLILGLSACGSSDDDKDKTPVTDKDKPPVDTHYPSENGNYVKTDGGYSEISDGKGGVLYEAVAFTPEMKFDKARSLKAFRETLYPYVRSLPNTSPSGAAKPLYADNNVELAHEYALTQVNFYNTRNSKIVTDLSIYRKNCVNECAIDAIAMQTLVEAWKTKIKDMLYQTPTTTTTGNLTASNIENWIAKDKLTIDSTEQEYIVYVSFLNLRDGAASEHEFNIARVGLSKALNSVSRWAPKIVNPVDVNGKGLLYRFDIRDYWGWNKGVTSLLFGGSDDDISFGQKKRDYLGNLIGNELNTAHALSETITQDAKLAKLIWQRILHGEVEGAKANGNLVPRLDGFYGKRSQNLAGTYIKASDLKWVDVSQLVYTLTRPDVYAAIMMIPMHAKQLEDELGVDKSKGMDSFDFFVTFDAPTVDNQFSFKANRTDGGFYWKTFEIFTGNLENGDRNIYDIYKDNGDDIRFPFWANPIPQFVQPDKVEADTDFNWSFVATLAQIGPAQGFTKAEIDGCDAQPGAVTGFGYCRHYTGTGGMQQASSTIIWDLPNGLNGYMRTGGHDQRRIDAFANIIRDPRLIPEADDNIATQTGYSYTKSNQDSGITSDPRFNTSSSYISLYPDGLNRTPNDLRDWLDNDRTRLPKGPYGVDSWINDEATVARVKELYPSTADSRDFFEQSRKTFLTAMGKIQQQMVHGADKNVYVEPVIWLVEDLLAKPQVVVKPPIKDPNVVIPSIDPHVNSHTVLADGVVAKAIDGFTALSDGNSGMIYEAVSITAEMAFDKTLSLLAFKETLYPYLRSLPNVSPSGTSPPLYASDNIELAHEYALTQVYFRNPGKSKLVTELSVYRKNCVTVCADDASDMLAQIKQWKAKIKDTLIETPRLLAKEVEVTAEDITDWIVADRATFSEEVQPFMVYTSLHVLHNAGASADDLNIARVALSKALNSVARWAPRVYNPMDVNNKGILYRFDIRDYWGWNKGVTKLLFGGSDDDLAIGQNKRNYLGEVVNINEQTKKYDFSDTITKDADHAKLIWQRVLHGNVEGAKTSGNLKPNIAGFYGKRSSNSAGEYIKAEDFEWVEVTQLVYTLTRPDVYASIMMLPMTASELEQELSVDNSQGIDSYNYFVTLDAPTVDAQFAYKADTKYGGFYWKTFEVFTGQLTGGDRSIFDVYKEGGEDIRFPFWANPIPQFVNPQKVEVDDSVWSFIASLAQTATFEGFTPSTAVGCEVQPGAVTGFGYCKHYTGTGGQQQSESTIIWDLPNGLNGYMKTGGTNQRRIDSFAIVIRDPSLLPNAGDNISTHTGYGFDLGEGSSPVAAPRFNSSSSLMGIYADGLPRTNNDLRDWLDKDPASLPKGPYGVDDWINDAATVARVKELYPTTAEAKGDIELRRKIFLTYMAKIKLGIVVGKDKNIYVEPITWAIDEARKIHDYPLTTSN